MKLLLDTHIWLWMVIDPGQLSESAMDVVADPDNALHLSAVTYWEIALLAEGGRIDLGGDTRSWIDCALREFPVLDLAMTREVAVASQEFVDLHKDPADRFLAATARTYGLQLATRDARLLAAPDVPTFAA